MKWNNNLNEIIDQDEEIFFNNPCNKSLVITKDIDQTDNNPLNISSASWGKYFSKRSPAVSEIFESDREKSLSVDPQKEFDHINTEMAIQTNLNDSAYFNHSTFPNTKHKNSNSTFSNSNSTCSDPGSLTNIHVNSLKHIQRFYQFKIKKECNNNQQKIESIINKYIHKINGQLLAITINPQTNSCTILVLFRDKNKLFVNNDEWIEHFLSYSPILNIMDESIKPTFTQLSH